MEGEGGGSTGENRDRDKEMQDQQNDLSSEVIKQSESNAINKDNSTRESKKRKADGTPEIAEENLKEEERSFYLNEIKKLSDAITGVFNYANSLPQTKAIAKVRKDLKDRTDNLMTLVDSVIEENLVKFFKEGTFPKGRELNFEPDSTVAKMYCEQCSKEITDKEEEKRKILNQIQEARTLGEEEFKELAGKKWPVEAYCKSKEIIGNPLASKDGDLLLCFEDSKEDSNLKSMLRIRFPEAEEILEDEEGDNLQFLESVTRTTKGVVNRKMVNIAKLGKEGDWRKVFLDLKTELVVSDCKKLAVAVSKQEGRDLVRKCLEIVFKEVDVEIEIMVPKSSNLEGYQDQSTDRRNRYRKQEAVIIKTDVTTYAETLKNIRAVVNPDDIGVGVKSVKMTKDNKVVIVTEEGKAESLHREIAAKVKGVETRVSGSKKTLVILDIDATINGKEVEEYIRKATREFETQVRNLRTGRGGTQIAIVSMSSKAADELLSEGMIKIGWTYCRVKPKIDILRCFNCLNIGHHSDICTETRNEKKCLNCTKTGHLVKECENSSYCTSCKKEGHRSDSTSCPAVKRLLQGRRMEETQSVHNREDLIIEEEINATSEDVNKDVEMRENK